MTKKIAVVAVGGNALIQQKGKESIADQYTAASQTMGYVAEMIQAGWDVVVTHGNGPQVGFALRRSELAAAELPPVPLDYCGAETQGWIGYMFQKALNNVFAQRGITKHAATVVTQCLVDAADPAFANPTKPIGSFVDEQTAQQLRAQGKHVVEDSGRGWREVVASPQPQEIVEAPAIQQLIESGFMVVACGGGGIPVVKEGGELKGVAAVIDKDFASSLLAGEIDAELLLISTGVEQVMLHYNTPQQRALERMTVAEAKQYIEEGHFAPGSMLPKIQAAMRFVEAGGKHALITDPANIARALRGETGTWISLD
ncbi:MAG TPA: carbamate kinase [Anaerolineales bacterium]|nr:carbamate kinase [Anaerolineales bacterium]HRQ92054.1 carbamate kinase [Anaerolineales bacterium]